MTDEEHWDCIAGIATSMGLTAMITQSAGCKYKTKYPFLIGIAHTLQLIDKMQPITYNEFFDTANLFIRSFNKIVHGTFAESGDMKNSIRFVFDNYTTRESYETRRYNETQEKIEDIGTQGQAL